VLDVRDNALPEAIWKGFIEAGSKEAEFATERQKAVHLVRVARQASAQIYPADQAGARRDADVKGRVAVRSNAWVSSGA
jgi:hypothetical protein